MLLLSAGVVGWSGMRPQAATRSSARMGAATDTSTALSGRVVPTEVNSIQSWYDAGVRLSVSGPQPHASAVSPDASVVSREEVLLKRYLQLNTILTTAQPMSDDAVEALILKAEAAAGPLKFDEQLVAGEWRQVFTRTAKEGTTSQKALSTDKTKSSWQNFIRDDNNKPIFRNIIQVSKRRCEIVFDVAYDTPAADAEQANRLTSTIATAGLYIKLGQRFGWKPLRIPLPLKGEGWLDVTYQSDDMRITRGNRGGVFVHMRPDILTRAAAEA